MTPLAPDAAAPYTPPMTKAQAIVDIGRRYWGANWVAGMSDLAGINHRTLQRIHVAAQAGEEYPAAGGVIAALREALTAVLAELEPWAAP